MPASHGDATYTASGTTGSFNAAKPANVVNGSVLLAFHNQDTGALSDMGTPTGGTTWNLLTSLLSTPGNFKLWWKVAGSSEPANYGFTQNSGSDGAVTIIRVAGANGSFTPTIGTATGNTANGTTISTPGLTPPTADCIEYRFACGTGGGAASWSIAASSPSFTALNNIQSGTFSNHRAFYRVLSSASATAAETATSSISQDGSRQAVSVAIRSGTSEVTGAAALSAETSLSASAKLDVKASADLSAQGILSAAYEVPKVFGSSVLAAEGFLAVAAKLNVKGAAAMSAQSNMNVSGYVQAAPIIDPPLFPHATVEVQFVDGVWTDITPFFRGATVTRGVSRVDSPVNRYETGTATVRLDNRDRRFDPTNLAGPYVANFATDTSSQNFTASTTFTFGIGVSIAVKSATGQNATIGNVTSKASGTTSSYTVNKPSGTANGKRMIAIASCDVGLDTNMTISGGSSWGTPILSVSMGEGTIQTRVWSKIAGGSEPASYTLGQASGADGVCVIAYLDGADTSVTPVADYDSNPERLLFSTPGVAIFGDNDLDLRWAAGNGSGTSGVQWTSPTSEGFYEYADKQSGSFTSGVFAARSLEGYGGTGTETRIIPMLPMRIRAEWEQVTTTNLIENPSFEETSNHWSGVTAESSILRSDAFSYRGGQSLRVSRLAENSPFNLYGAKLASTGIAAGTAGGQTVTLSAYVYIPNESFSKITSINFGVGGTTNGFVNMPPAADGWYRLQRTMVLSGAATDVQIQFWTDNTHGDGQTVAYIDAVQLEIQPLARMYTDGSLPACTWSGTAHDSSSNRPAEITFDVFNGYIDDWEIDWEGDYESEVVIQCSDGFVVLADDERVAVAAVGANELSGARVNRILDSVGWDPAKRDIAAGNTQLQATTLSGDALTELFLVADTEIGEFYQNAAGTMVFRNRRALMTDTRSVQVQAHFGDGGDVLGELPYHHVGIKYSAEQLVNEVRIARTGGVQQTVEDAASKAKYRRTRTYERTDLLMTSDGEAAAHASWILYIAKDAELRFEELIIRPQKLEEELFPQCLAREIGDRISVKRRPVDNTASFTEQISREVFIRGVKHEIGQWFWETTFHLQSASKVGNFLTLNHPELGRIGRNALVY